MDIEENDEQELIVDENIKNLFRVLNVPSDTQMRTILDSLESDLLRPMFNDVFGQLQRGKALEPYVFHDGCYLVSMDGMGYFSSKKIHCKSCLQKKNSKTGEITYHHQMLGAAVVHPGHKQVIPLAPEPIIKQDGDNKNDCERNAGKRLLQKIGNEHPNLKLIVVEDGFASNAPHILQWKSLDMHFILGAKPDDHEHLFDEASQAEAAGRVTTLRWTDNTKKEAVQCEVRFAHNLPLNKSNADLLVNFLQYTEYASDGSLRKRFSWATDLRITRDNAHHLARGGRARWKIENETLNVRAEVEVLQRSVGGGIGSENTATYTYSIARHAARTSPLLSNLRIFQSEQLNPATGPTQGHLAGNCWL